ncbi:hypothetical protein E2C01_070607 [Portunus trituberculatus]|uniref:Uncharacterized protein n=1 Tax=Portunus trituberculatus TaxID=210409 RepID=A0A5B7HUL2_PORTR|nr:hypothetical protein [Portunus trituberculatus]
MQRCTRGHQSVRGQAGPATHCALSSPSALTRHVEAAPWLQRPQLCTAPTACLTKQMPLLRWPSSAAYGGSGTL